MNDRKPDVTRAEVEVFRSDVNGWVIRTPGRAYPAAVIQGDSLSILFDEAQKLLDDLRDISGIDPHVIEDARGHRDKIWRRLLHYETALEEHGINLPYNRHRWPK
jgi:hypothetical protein